MQQQPLAVNCSTPWFHKKKLEIRLQERALKVAQERVSTVARSMALEDQAVDDALTQSQIEELAKALLAKNTKDLW